MDITNVVRHFVVETFLFGEDEKLREDTSFIESGMIDSTGILELAAFLEETFGFRLKDNELIPENLERLPGTLFSISLFRSRLWVGPGDGMVE